MTTDQDTTRIVWSWLRVDEHESADRVLDTVVALLDATPQRRAWWPARRFADMNAYAKLLVAAAAVLVVALGINVFFTRQGDVAAPATPSPSPSAEPSASAAVPAGPLVVTAELRGGPDIGKTTYTEVDGRVERRGTIWDLPFTASDPRLQGRFTQSNDQDADPGPDGPESHVFSTQTIRIETADGAWQGSGSGFAVAEQGGGGTVILVGEGAYEGLYAALDMTDATNVNGIDGVIFPAPPPVAPAAPRSSASFASPPTGPSPAEPLVITAALQPGDDIGNTTSTEVDGRVERRGTVWALPFTASDPRLQGDFTQSADQDAYPGPDGPESFVLATHTTRIETADGAWQGSETHFDTATGTGGYTVVLAGEGAYEGLYAALDMTDATNSDGIRGVIFPAPPPAAPAAP